MDSFKQVIGSFTTRDYWYTIGTPSSDMILDEDSVCSVVEESWVRSDWKACVPQIYRHMPAAGLICQAAQNAPCES